MSSKYPMQSLLHHWSFKFRPSQYIVPDRTTDYMNQEMAHFCSLQYCSLSTYSVLPSHKWFSRSLKLQSWKSPPFFLQNSTSNWSFQTQIYAVGNETTPSSQLKLSPYQIVVHAHPRTPLTFSLRLLSDGF